jgi:NAD(P)-dependent dehydrogenase (short-subunit alcohol dehydrogenase family)
MNQMKHQGKAAIVTGGATGIGAGIARKLAADGSKVLIVDIDEAGADASAGRIRESGGTASSMRGDVSKEEVARSMVERAVDEYGRLDILVQNAYGVIGFSDGSALEVDVDSWRKGMDLLVMAHFLGAKYGVPAMTDSGPPSGFDPGPWAGGGLRHGSPPPMEVGRIVNISSVHGLLQAAGTMVYESGKAAVIGLTRQMAIDFGPLGITVNAIAPGHIVTEGLEKLWSEVANEAGFRLHELQYPVRRTGVPEDIGNAVSFLCSEEAAFITGVVLPVDGGLSIQLQENIVLELKSYIQEHPGLKTFFDGGYGTGDRK